MDRKTGDLVAEPLQGDDDDFFEDLEVEDHRFHSLGAELQTRPMVVAVGIWRVLYMFVPEGVGRV